MSCYGTLGRHGAHASVTHAQRYVVTIVVGGTDVGDVIKHGCCSFLLQVSAGSELHVYLAAKATELAAVAKADADAAALTSAALSAGDGAPDYTLAPHLAAGDSSNNAALVGTINPTAAAEAVLAARAKASAKSPPWQQVSRAEEQVRLAHECRYGGPDCISSAVMKRLIEANMDASQEVLG